MAMLIDAQVTVPLSVPRPGGLRVPHRARWVEQSVLGEIARILVVESCGWRARTVCLGTKGRWPCRRSPLHG